MQQITYCLYAAPIPNFPSSQKAGNKENAKTSYSYYSKESLRLPEAASDLSELTNGSFNCIIGDDLPTKKLKSSNLQRKVYYDLKKARDSGISDVVLLRLEQLYPFLIF